MKLYHHILRQASRIGRCNQGVAFIEFALCLPFLVVLFLGTVEVSRYLLAVQKIEKTLDLTTDIVGRADMNSSSEKLTTETMASLFSSIPSMMNPYEMGSNGIVIITNVSQPSDLSKPPQINWQYCGGGTLSKNSVVGAASGDSAKPAVPNSPLPYNFTLLAGEEILIGEIYYNFTPIASGNIIGDIQVSRVAIFAPRIGSLSSFSSKCAGG